MDRCDCQSYQLSHPVEEIREIQVRLIHITLHCFKSLKSNTLKHDRSLLQRAYNGEWAGPNVEQRKHSETALFFCGYTLFPTCEQLRFKGVYLDFNSLQMQAFNLVGKPFELPSHLYQIQVGTEDFPLISPKTCKLPFSYDKIITQISVAGEAKRDFITLKIVTLRRSNIVIAVPIL